jgi:hypothetical protein
MGTLAAIGVPSLDDSNQIINHKCQNEIKEAFLKPKLSRMHRIKHAPQKFTRIWITE